MDFGDIRHDLLYMKNLNNTLRKPTDVGMSNFFSRTLQAFQGTISYEKYYFTVLHVKILLQKS